MVRPGQAAPSDWGGCDRLQVGQLDAATADALGAAWQAREPLVIELVPGLGLDDPVAPPLEAVTGLDPWEWEPDLDLVGERLHHGLWANSVDCRDSSRPRYRWAEAALALGARPGGAGPGDVVLPDGRPAICDGGPLDASLSARAGVATLHRVGLEHGSLAPLGGTRPAGSGLAPDQLAAVTEPLAGARVIAPAGSGKTRVLTERARLLCQGWGLPPGAMALVAYNVRAAEEVRARLAEVPSLRVRTLNALSFRLCGRQRTIEEPEARRVLSSLVDLPRRAESDPAAPWLEALSRVRIGLARPDDIEEEVGDVSDLARVARAYREELRRAEAADFDEQVTAAVERLLADPVFRRRSQRFARVLLVDEFQDLAPAHLLLVRLLAGPAGAVFGVGDDDQTIYGYAGATPRWLVDFGRWFPGSADHPLEVNYRCPAPVVQAAGHLLARNSVRVDKSVRAAKAQDAGALSLQAGADRPAATTVARVTGLLADGVDPADIAVLARVNASLVPVQVMLRHAGVPVNRAGDERFLQRAGVRAVLAWLAVADAPAAGLPGASMREAARRPKRGMSQSLLDLVAKRRSLEGLAKLAGWLEGKGSAREAAKVLELAGDVRAVRRAAAGPGATTASVLAVVRSQVGEGGLDASADALDRWSHGAIAAHGDDLAALAELAEQEPDVARFAGWLSGHLSAPGDGPGVTLASVHSVKGREWPHVVVHHATAGLLPHRLAWDLEEERRIFHVALTRCLESCTVVTGEPPSPFVAEMSAAPVPGAAGGSVRQPGAGGPTSAGRPPAIVGPGRVGGRPGRTGGQPPLRSPRVSEAVPAVVGLSFSVQGHEYVVVEVGDAGARAVVRGGRATTEVRFGSSVTRQGTSVLLGHPACEEAGRALRSWRSDRARLAGRPAYTVFDDRALCTLAAVLPTSEPVLAAVPGIGPVKLEAYGSELMAMCEALRAQAPVAVPGGPVAAPAHQ